MADGFMSSWRGEAIAAANNEPPVTVREETSADKLPRVHLNGSTMLDIRRALLLTRAGKSLGAIAGYRSNEAEDHVLFDALCSAADAAYVRPGAVVVPMGLAASPRRPWREGRGAGDASLLRLFGAVASPVLLDDGHGVRVRLRIALPRFQLTMWRPIAPQSAPRVAEVSLGIVLSGGDTAREGERVGFLVRVGNDDSVIEPVFMDETVGRRGIIGVWALSAGDVWTAAAVFAAESSTRRNVKVGHPGLSRLEKRRDVQFLVAQFHDRIGGDPVFLPCTATLPSQHEAQYNTYSAQLAVRADDPELTDGAILSADFSEEGGKGEGPMDTRRPPPAAAADAVLRANYNSARQRMQNSVGAQRSTCESAGDESDEDKVEDLDAEDEANASGLSNVLRNDVSDPDDVPDFLSPVSNARAHMANITQQMELLRADLRRVPEAVDADERTNALCRDRVEASSAVANSHIVNIELEEDYELGDEDNDEIYDISCDEIDPRLDALARKYLGANYKQDAGILEQT
jgi:hypothetical protein